MKRYFFIILIFCIFYANRTNLFAYDIVVIKDSDIAPYNMALDGFKRAVNARFAKNANIAEYVLGTSRKERKKIVDDINTNRPDIILSIGRNSILMIEDEIDNVPVVYCMVMDPENYSFIEKDNVTGIILRTPVKDQIEKIISIIPNIKNLGVIYNAGNTKYVIKEAKQFTEKVGINLVEAKIKSHKSVPKAFRKLVKDVDALWLPPDAAVITSKSIRFLILRSFANNLPLIVHAKKFVKAGALFSLSADYYKIGEQAARLTSNILLKREKITSPIIQPEDTDFVLNLKTARKIILNLSEEIINSADIIYK